MKETTGFEAFCLYHALKLHFTSSSYDIFRYNGKTNVSQDTFMKRKDKYSFYRLARKYDIEELRNFLVANFIYGTSTWVGEMTGPDGEGTYRQWQKTNQSLTYVFERDILKVLDTIESPDDMLKVTPGQLPKLLLEAVSGAVTIETVVILNSLLGFFPMWDKKIDDDFLWPNFRLKCEKYTPFVPFDKVKFKNILREQIEEHA